MTRIAIVGLVGVLALAAQVAAQPTPSCPGDCDLDGVVKIDELLRGVNFLLASEPPDGCEELDDDIDGQVEVNEIILAVLDALNGCRIEGDDAAEAGASAAVGVVDAFQVLDIGGAAAGAPGSSGGGGAAGSAGFPDLGSVAGQPPCPAGGTVEESCTSSATTSRLTVTYDDCRARGGEGGALELAVEGRIVRDVANGTYCATREILDGVRVHEEVIGFSQTVRTDDAVVVFQFTGDYTRESITSGVGCAGDSSTETLDGRLALRCDRGQEIPTCPSGGRDVSLRARGLGIARQSIQSPGPCARTRILSGRVDLRDGVSGQAFDAVYRQFRIQDLIGSGTPAPINFSGGLGLDCLGELSFSTEIPLRRAGDERCPSAGLLFLRLPGERQHALRYDRGALEIDLDRDGRPDVKTSSCEDASLRQCK